MYAALLRTSGALLSYERTNIRMPYENLVCYTFFVRQNFSITASFYSYGHPFFLVYQMPILVCTYFFRMHIIFVYAYLIRILPYLFRYHPFWYGVRLTYAILLLYNCRTIKAYHSYIYTWCFAILISFN